MQKMDLKELRERVRSAYADYDTKGDAVLEFEARNADLMAEIAVSLAREMHERNTPMEDVMNGFVAVTAMGLVNLCARYQLDPEHVVGNTAAMLRHYLVEGKDTSTDMVPMPTIDVGDA